MPGLVGCRRGSEDGGLAPPRCRTTAMKSERVAQSRSGSLRRGELLPLRFSSAFGRVNIVRSTHG